MNKIYSLVWNTSLNQVVAVSELTKKTGGSPSAAASTPALFKRFVLASAILAAMGGLAKSPAALAQAVIGPNQGIFVDDGTDSSCSEFTDTAGLPSEWIPVTGDPTVCGSSDKATQTNRTLFYNPAGDLGSNSLTLGNELYVNGGKLGLSDQGTGTYSMRIGSDATLASTPGLDSIAIGSAQTSSSDGASSAATTASGANAIAIGRASAATAGNSLALGSNATAAGDSSTAAGYSSNALGAFSTAIGNNSYAGGIFSSAVGRSARAEGYRSAAFGYHAVASSSAGIAVGNYSAALGAYSAAVGSLASATGIGSTALGTSTSAGGDGSTALGEMAAASFEDSTALGFAASANGQYSSALGANTFALGSRSTAVGAAAEAEGNYSAAFGNNSHALASSASAFGNLASAQNVGSAAVGYAASAIGIYSAALGPRSNAIGNYSAAIGNRSSAQGDFSMAFGNYSVSGTTNAVALGANSTASAQFGDVALGSGSATATVVGTSGATINGITYFGFAGAAPESTVSIGTLGNERTLTNVAAGRVDANSTDAINGSQLYSVANALSDQLMDDTTHYFSVNDGGIQEGNYANDGATAVNALAAGVDASASGASATALGDGATAGHANDVALGSGSVTGTPSVGPYTINGGTIAATSDTNGVVSVGAAGKERQIQNVAAGTVSATSTDAVNGSQLFAVGTQTNTNTTNLQNLGNSTAAGMGGTSSYNSATGALTTNLSVGGTSYTNVNSALNAVNGTASEGWNLSANGGTASNIAPGATVDVSQGSSGNIAVTQNGTDLTIDTNPDLNVTSVTAGNTVLNNAGVTISGGANGTVALGSTGLDNGGNVISNVANGINPTDAVNVSQLNSVVAGAATHYYSVNDGGTQGSNYDNDGATGVDSLAAGVNASATGDNSVAIGFDAVAANAGDVALGSGSITAAANPTTGATIDGTAYTFAGGNPTSVVSVGSMGNERQITNVAAGQLSATSTDAVNGSQLYATNQAVNTIGTQVKTNTTDISNIQTQINNINQNGSGMFQVSSDRNDQPAPTPTGTNSAAGGAGASASGNDALAVGNDSTASGNGSTAVGTGASATGDNSVAIGNGSVADQDDTVSVGLQGSERRITNVAAGVNGTDAVNVSQLKSAQSGGVHYDTNPDGSIDYKSVTLNPGGDSATVHNVSAGVADTDAVNVGQLNQGISTAENWSKNYTDQRIENLNSNLNALGHRADAGIASAMAMAGIPQAYQPNQNFAGVALSGFHGEAGIAVGVSKISESGRYILKASASSNTRGDAGFTVGAGVAW